MGNIQNLRVLVDESGAYLGGVLRPYDLTVDINGAETSKTVAGKYVTDNGNSITEHNRNVAGSIFVTKVTNPLTFASAYLLEAVGTVQGYIVNDSPECVQATYLLGENCSTPMHTQDCERDALIAKIEEVKTAVEGIEVNVGEVVLNSDSINLINDGVEQRLDTLIMRPVYQLVYGPAMEVCVQNEASRQTMLVRDVVYYSTIDDSETPYKQFSTDGVNWTTEVPYGSFTIGACKLEYNRVEQRLIQHPATSIVPAGQYHGISYKIISGIVNVTIDGVTVAYEKGEFDAEEATTLLASAYEFAPLTGGVVKIKLVY